MCLCYKRVFQLLQFYYTVVEHFGPIVTILCIKVPIWRTFKCSSLYLRPFMRVDLFICTVSVVSKLKCYIITALLSLHPHVRTTLLGGEEEEGRGPAEACRYLPSLPHRLIRSRLIDASWCISFDLEMIHENLKIPLQMNRRAATQFEWAARLIHILSTISD